jgi:helicase
VAIRQLARAMRRQAVRIGAGLPSETLWLMSLDLQRPPRRLSRKQILALRCEGMTRAIDLMNGAPEADQARRRALEAIANPQLANAVRSAALRWRIEDRAYCKRQHSKRAIQFGAFVAIEAFYKARNDAFEVAFEGLLNVAAIDFQKLDGRGKIGHPDYLVNIEELPSLVFELKSKASEEEVVSYNQATEVLAASEIIGRRDNFCITLCNPGIEPSVPALIEACGRLCVVDACDFAEAILRVREGRLTRADLHNWLTTPGIALRGDLPPPR